MRLASLVNEYTSEQQPWALVKTDRDRAATVLYVALSCVDNLKILFTPFLPFSSQRLHELLGHEGEIAGPPDSREHADDDGTKYGVLTGDYGTLVGGGSRAPSRPASLSASRSCSSRSSTRTRWSRRS